MGSGVVGRPMRRAARGGAGVLVGDVEGNAERTPHVARDGGCGSPAFVPPQRRVLDASIKPRLVKVVHESVRYRGYWGGCRFGGGAGRDPGARAKWADRLRRCQ